MALYIKVWSTPTSFDDIRSDKACRAEFEIIQLYFNHILCLVVLLFSKSYTVLHYMGVLPLPYRSCYGVTIIISHDCTITYSIVEIADWTFCKCILHLSRLLVRRHLT